MVLVVRLVIDLGKNLKGSDIGSRNEQARHGYYQTIGVVVNGSIAIAIAPIGCAFRGNGPIRPPGGLGIAIATQGTVAIDIDRTSTDFYQSWFQLVVKGHEPKCGGEINVTDAFLIGGSDCADVVVIAVILIGIVNDNFSYDFAIAIGHLH